MSIARSTAFAAAFVSLVLSMPGMASAETIAGAMARAYQNNPDLNSVRAALRATDESVTIAKAGYRPHVTATSSVTGVDIGDISNGVKRYQYRESSIGVSITQQIFDGFQTLNRVRAAEANVVANRESMKADEISILLSAAEAYANVARDQQIVAIRDQNLAFLREQVKAADSRLDVGEGTTTDVAQAQAQLAASEALLAGAVSQLKQDEATYVQVTGVMPKGIKQPSPPAKAMPRNLDNAVAVAITEHPSVLAALHSVDAAGYTVKTAEGVLLPGVVLKGTVNRAMTTEEPSNSNPNYVTGSVTAQITVPIYQGGSEFGQIRQAKEQLSQRRILVDSARANVQQTVVAAYAQMEAARAAITANKKQLAASRLALNGVIEERNVGQSTTLDVLNAQQNVLNARESLVSSQRNEVVAGYSVIAAMGRLTVHSQDLQVAEYRAEEHYEAVKDKWFGLRTVDGR